MGKLQPLTQPAAKTDLVLYEGVTTSDGTTLTVIDSSLIGSNDFLTNVTLYIDSGAADKEIRDISLFNNTTGTITVSTAFSTQILSGILYKILAIIPADIEVTDIKGTGFDTATDSLVKLHDDHLVYINDVAITGETAFSIADILKVSATEKVKNFIAKTGGTEIPTGKSLYDIISLLQGLVYYGSVTTYTDTTHFKSTALIGYGNAYFKDYYVYVVRDAGGAGAAPQGESQQISAYTSADGTITHTAFTTPLAVTDIVLLIHQDVAELKDILDLARTYGSVACSAVEASLFIDDAPVRATVGRAVNVDLSVMAAGDTYVLREYYRLVAMGSYIKVSDDASNTFIGAQSPAVVTVELNPYLYGCKITAIKTAGTDRTLNYESFVEA